MPTLEWTGKKAVLNHHREVPYHLLRCDGKLSVGDEGSGNLLVQGDNLLALKALLPYYAGQVKCIYIDPPYNTGNENWVYNDAVNSPEMRSWLGRVVGGEAEDLSRHSKWLCMMYPRLSLLKQFLSADGAIFISIDDNELANLKLVADEVFGPRSCVAILTWYKRVSPANDAKYFSSDHEYVVVYAKNKAQWHPHRLPRSTEQLKNYKNPDDDPRGPWNSATYTCNKSAEERPNLYHGITNPNTGEVIWPRKTAVWKYDAAAHQEHVRQNLVWWGKDGQAKMPRIKLFLDGVRDVVPRSVLPYVDCGSTQEARTELLSLIEEVPFTTPKPVRLIKRILHVATNKDSLVLDSFAGSGTTGHAVLDLNKADGGSRRFIMVEMDENICRNITAQRVSRAAAGYARKNGNGESVSVPPLGGGFRYCTLGSPLFDEHGNIAGEVKFDDLAAHVYFAETGQPLPKRKNGRSPLLGVHNGAAVYLLYNGILGDKRVNGGNVLTASTLASLPAHDGPRVIYGEGNRMGRDRLKREGVAFRQIPYEIKVG
ncbi:MAG: site-specific DNA-methyltransferase [Planctomycetota bacterium]|nr:site-specific DNA-methyltransferase [Planctomycetota bacterium]